MYIAATARKSAEEQVCLVIFDEFKFERKTRILTEANARLKFKLEALERKKCGHFQKMWFQRQYVSVKSREIV